MSTKTNAAPKILPALTPEEIAALNNQAPKHIVTNEEVRDAFLAAGEAQSKNADCMIKIGEKIFLATVAKNITPLQIEEHYKSMLLRHNQNEYGAAIATDKKSMAPAVSQLNVFYRLASTPFGDAEKVIDVFHRAVPIINDEKKHRVPGSNYAMILKIARAMIAAENPILSDADILNAILPQESTDDPVLKTLRSMKKNAESKAKSDDGHFMPASKRFQNLAKILADEIASYEAELVAEKKRLAGDK